MPLRPVHRLTGRPKVFPTEYSTAELARHVIDTDQDTRGYMGRSDLRLDLVDWAALDRCLEVAATLPAEARSADLETAVANIEALLAQRPKVGKEQRA